MIRARVSVPNDADKALERAVLAAAKKLADEVVLAADAPPDTYDLTLHVLPDPET